LGRRFRALKLWCVLRSFGVRGLQEHIRRGVELTRLFASWVETDPRWELVAPTPLNLVCFRHVEGDELTLAVNERVNATGSIYLNYTRLDDRVTLRMALGAAQTRRHHVEAAWALIQETARAIAGE